MPITSAQKAAIEEIIDILVSTTPARGKRQLSAMFMDLVDRADWPEYYEVIPEPRCINGVRASVEKNRYKDPINAYTDLSLVFWNALFYNEPGSQIASDAETLKSVLETEWQKRPVLPAPRHSPPPSSPQKVHGTLPTAPPQSDPSKFTHLIAKPRSAAEAAAPASGSTTANTHPPQKLAPRRGTPPARPSLPEMMDVDVQAMSPEPDSQVDTTASAGAGEDRDGDSEAIIRQLEKSLPRWEGFGDLGWMSEVTQERRLEIVLAIKSHKDIVGNRLAVALEAVPEEPTSPLLSHQSPLSLKLIEGRVRSTSYASSKIFDVDMARLFEKGRRWYDPSTESYGRVLVLQRLYQALTSPSPPAGPPYTSPTHFASIRAGPGTARPMHATADADGVPGITTFRVSTKDRTFVDEVHYKGWTIRMADWLHLSNPDDPSRPIVGHVFKCWISDEAAKKGQPGISICWYYRPEQTFHPAHAQFMDKEVFKTSLFADHPVEDVLEKIAVQFTARHIRGRPRSPFWYPGWPLYVCHSRYNERERVFVKIKNWASCIPEEVRKKDEFMPIYGFERMVYPAKVPSPFVSATGVVKGPGGIGEPLEKAEGEKNEGGGTGRKRARRNQGTGTEAGSSTALTKMAMTALQMPMQTPGPAHAQVPKAYAAPAAGGSGSGDTKDRSMLTAAGTLTVAPIVDKLSPETTVYFDRSPETNEVLWFAAPPLHVARAPVVKHSLKYLTYLAGKRKESEGDGDGDGETKQVNGRDGKEDEGENKRVGVAPTVSEMMQTAMDGVRW
ncbi:hypothetical protein J3R82DRAFT_2911 [Butyriboletus roseoflavus]|nr:hypothetical protein J3R82DRAFT_2911 [Butyriboletus roseoflavus]